MVGPNDNTLNPENEANSPKKSWLERLVEGSAPVQRDVDTAYTRLNRDGKAAGSFVLALYQLAQKPRELRAQQFEKEFIKRSKQQDADYAFKHQDLVDAQNPILQDLVSQFYPESKKDVKQRLDKVHAELYHSDLCLADDIVETFIRIHKSNDPDYQFHHSHLLQDIDENALDCLSDYFDQENNLVNIQDELKYVHDLLFPKELCEAEAFIEEYISRKKIEDDSFEINPKQLSAFKEKDIAGDPVLSSMMAARNIKETQEKLAAILGAIYDDRFERKSIQKEVKKSAFELATLPTHNEDEIRRIFQKEIDWQMREGKIPQKEFKARLPEWLKHLEKAGFDYADSGANRYRSITLTVNNTKPKFKENALHFFMDKMAWFSTGFAALSAFILTSNPLWGLAWGAAVYATSVNEKAFDAFDYAERLWQDMRWTFSKNVLNSRKFSPEKAVKSMLFIGALAAVMVSGTMAAFTDTLAAPLISNLPWFAASTIALAVTAWGTINAVLGRSIPHRFIHGLGFHDNAISMEVMQKAHLKPVPENDVLSTKRKLAQARGHLEMFLEDNSYDSSSREASVEFNSYSDSEDDQLSSPAPLAMQYQQAANERESDESSRSPDVRRSPRLNT